MDLDFNWSDFDWFDFNSRYLGLTLSHHLLPLDEIYQSPPHHKDHRFPVEIVSEIFLYTVPNDPRSRTNLMLVCRHWYGIMLSTPGIHSQLRINKWTTAKRLCGEFRHSVKHHK